jgi:hypothetical protein
MIPASENGVVRLNVSIDLDGAFLRQTCPSCGLDFKTDTSDSDRSHALQAEVRLESAELGTPSDPLAGDDPATLSCPYCYAESTPSELVTEERFEYFRAIAYAQIVLPSFRRMLGGLASGSHSSIKYERSSTPDPSPVPCGPEPQDLIPVSLLCCARRVKVLPMWRDLSLCPYCQTPIRTE